MKFERERTRPIKRAGKAGLNRRKGTPQPTDFVVIESVSEARLCRELTHMHGISSSRIAILTHEDGSYVQVAGSGMTCCMEWRDMKRHRHFRAFHQPPVVPWPGITNLPVSGGDISLRQEEYFRIYQVTESFLAFFRHQPFPTYVQWRDITEELSATGCEEF